MGMIKPPTAAELQEISKKMSWAIDEGELEAYVRYLVHEVIPAFTALDEAEDELSASLVSETSVRDPGHFPTNEENRLGAWAWKCRVKGKTEGLLSGKRIALKDNVALAGVPMANGTSIMKGYVSKVDAEVARRILSAGGEIVGKATCENFCWTGGSGTSYPQRVLNPHNPERMAGGSSSGSGALVGAKEVDMAIGADQGGSIRIPSSWCGVFGLKPTYGLVPYTGLITGEMTFDHVGPMAQSVEDLARFLQVLAGKDGIDPRQQWTPTELPKYFDQLNSDVAGLKIGIVTEGFGWKESEPDVDRGVRRATTRFEELGAKVSELSIPLHRKAAMYMLGIDFEGSWRALRNGGINFGAFGYQDGDLAGFLGTHLSSGEAGFSLNARVTALFGQYMLERYHGVYYAKAQNVRQSVRKAYNDALKDYDLLVMPTTPQKAQPFPKEAEVENYVIANLNMTANVAPFDYTGHPGMNVPCGFSEGLPIGMMLVGKHFGEQTLLNAALAFEKLQQ
jgi:amidase